MSAVPVWIQILQALLTPTIAVAVGVIGFLQWRTAHQKVVLDLFDRRLAVVNEINDSVNYALSENGNLVSINAAMRLYDCEAKSLFLFGSDVVTLIGQIREDILLFHRLKFELDRAGSRTATEANDINEKCGKAFFLIAEHQKEFVQRILPFMRMHTKTVSSPAEWFNERNQIRQSFADKSPPDMQ